MYFFGESEEGILKSSSKKKVFFNKILLRITFITSFQNCIQIESFIILFPTSRPLCQFFLSFLYFFKWNSKSWNCCKQSRRFWSVYVLAWKKIFNISDCLNFYWFFYLFIVKYFLLKSFCNLFYVINFIWLSMQENSIL